MGKIKAIFAMVGAALGLMGCDFSSKTPNTNLADMNATGEINQSPDCTPDLTDSAMKIQCILHTAVMVSDLNYAAKQDIIKRLDAANAQKMMAAALQGYNDDRGRSDVVVAGNGSVAMQVMGQIQAANVIMGYAFYPLREMQRQSEKQRGLNEYSVPNGPYQRVRATIDDTQHVQKCLAALVHMPTKYANVSLTASFCMARTGNGDLDVSVNPMTLARFRPYVVRGL